MNNLIAKKYAKAIIERTDMEDFYYRLSVLNSAFCMPKFKDIINSNQIQKDKKLDLLNSFFEKINPNFINFLKILLKNSRLNHIPQIFKELQRQRALKENICQGIIYSKETLNDDKIKELENKLNLKLNTKIKLKNEISQNDGIKIYLEELGYEIAFSIKAFQNKISEYILKII
ncbi:F0F1 ATP synthase subunit delta [Campylobacter sp. RM9939]|uniref:F0F1 ATP synthase subunit delta n=1 Tax=Campylobacter molothri TaxID=1032242 RepID=UPI001E0FA464|nr:F0F1 ATP synthase subunit delta [Campylobacter sp. RM10536]MBZ7952585.1 F0F1 ATP synthase subunit delta [Campylobacter sp. RM9939]MBZ7957144.1 F0F1 ATP synthase subunit delta [Campylobacter sp. RM10541]